MEPLPIRFITVTDVTRITPRMARITFGGEDLADLHAEGPDQQVKLYFPRPGQAVPRLPRPGPDEEFAGWYAAYNAIPEPERPWMRSFTLRAHHPERAEIQIDFILHDHGGPAGRWGRAAAPGDTLGMFGPSSLFARPVPLASSIGAADWLLLAGDETALPGIGTLIEWLPEGTRALAYIEVHDRHERQEFDTRGQVTVHWLHRDGVPAGRGGVLLDAVRNAQFPPGSGFAWLAGEAGTVRSLRRHLLSERGLDRRAIDFTGYWRRKLTQDDDPTEQDLADAQELLARAQELVADAHRTAFDRAYAGRTAPWVIGQPQPAIVALERDGWIRGRVLDPGCGTGEHTIHLARLGYDVLGIDLSPVAIEQARATAAERGVAARFEVADALDLGDRPAYDTVVDSALFHIFAPAERARYVRSLELACRPGALVHILALSDAGPGFGPQIGDTVIREAFGQGWTLEALDASRYRGVVGAGGELGDLPAWLARVRRT